MVTFVGDILRSLFEPKPIYSRHKANDIIGDIIDENENFVFGLDKRDSLFKRRRTYWFVTEMKVIFVRNQQLLRQDRYIYNLDTVSDMRVFEDESMFVLDSVSGQERVALETELDYTFANQAIEQYNRVQEFLKQHDIEDVGESSVE